MLEATVFRNIKEHAMKPGFALIQIDGMHSIPFPNPVMLSITKINTLISANSMLHSSMEFLVTSAEARINISKPDQVSARDRTSCLVPDDPSHLVTG